MTHPVSGNKQEAVPWGGLVFWRGRVARFALPAINSLLHSYNSITSLHLPMSSENANARAPEELLRNSSLYREFQAEREEILKHKWIESEKAGYDIGFERALTDWILKHRSKWRKTRLAKPNKR
jgi:hypothetical protein